MVEQWVGEVIGKIHQQRITAKELAAHLNYNPKYLSTVLNGHRTPKNAEAKIRQGLEEMIEAKKYATGPDAESA